MSKKYSIVCNEDNSFTIENGDGPMGEKNIGSEVKDMISFSFQYLYTVLNQNEIILPDSAKQKVIDTINSFVSGVKDPYKSPRSPPVISS